MNNNSPAHQFTWTDVQTIIVYWGSEMCSRTEAFRLYAYFSEEDGNLKALSYLDIMILLLEQPAHNPQTDRLEDLLCSKILTLPGSL